MTKPDLFGDGIFRPSRRIVLTLIYFYPNVMNMIFGFPDPEPIFLLKVATI
jgi:hypothetical protein